MGIEGQGKPVQWHFYLSMKVQHIVQGMYPAVGAGAALHIRAAAHHLFQGILEGLAYADPVGLNLKSAIVGAVKSQVQTDIHYWSPGTKKRVEKMIPKARKDTAPLMKSCRVNRRTFSRVRPSPPW